MINTVVENGSKIELKYKKKRGIVVLRKIGNMIYVSGHGPEDQITGKALYNGRIGDELTLEEGYDAARECGKIILGALKDALGSLDKIDQFVKVFGVVNCGENFTDIDKVMNGFSDVISEALEEKGYHTRTDLGTRNLPNGNIPVEVEVIVRIKE